LPRRALCRSLRGIVAALPDFTAAQWLLTAIAAACIGISKSGFSGMGLVTVIVMAKLFPPLESTGILLPLLIWGDICAVAAFRKHAQWPLIWRMLPPTALGIIVGYVLMQQIPAHRFGPVIGAIVFGMALIQAGRKLRPELFLHVPHTRGFAYLMGGGSGIATMLANAAGPVMALYFLAINVPKYAFVGTAAWFFLIVNIFKVPFSASMGLIDVSSLLFNLVLMPCVICGTLLGRWLIAIVPQGLFEILLLIFAFIASLRMMNILPFF
jgi:uncharacterized membrane protein YfcA